MKVKSIFQNAIRGSSYHTRRGGRSGRRDDFRRLPSFNDDSEHCEPHLHQNARCSGTRAVLNDRADSSKQNLIPDNPLSIELDTLQGTPRVNNHFSSNSSQSPARSETHRGRDLFGTRCEFDQAQQIYSPTSEEIPSNEHEDDAQEPFAFSNVHLKFREVISGESGDVVEDVFFSQRGRSRNFIQTVCSCCPYRARTGKLMIFMVSTISVILICTVTISLILLGLGKNNNLTKNVSDSVSDFEFLSSREWPLHDIDSNELNISFNTVQRQHQRWDFKLENDDKVENKSGKGVDLHAKSQATKHYPGLLTLHGHIIDQTIAENVFNSAKQLLDSNLHENSTKLDILKWKGEAVKFALQELNYRFNITRNGDALEGLFEDNLCANEIPLPCNATSWFRSINGACNNVFHSNWGSQYAPFRRIINPSSAKSKTKKVTLTNSISGKLTGGTPVEDPEISAILPLWSMFILHDTLKIADSPVPCFDLTDKNSSDLSDNHDFHTNAVRKEGCERVTAPGSDFHEKVKCFPLSPCPASYPTCKVGPRTSFNLVTSYIDASNIYGSSEEKMDKLRLKTMGKMKTSSGKHKNELGFLPLAAEQNETCVDGSGISCFISGDDDVNQFSGLTALNTIFVRQHNSMAFFLHRLNPHWDDERLFQESRRILIAQLQHITYNEFLPSIFGNQWMNFSGLQLENNGFYELYDPVIDASVSDAFAGAVGYFWYSMAVGKVFSVWKWGKYANKVKHSIITEILNPEFLMDRRGHLEAVIKGLASSAVHRIGLEFSPLLRFLHIKPLNMTVDVVKLAIEKGRQLGIAPYNEWRRACGFTDIKGFQGFKDHWRIEAYTSISSVYKNLEDVDLLVGLLAEKPIPEGKVGPTLACLLTDQFLRFKKGDRFWYEGDVYFDHFTEPQLNSIRETTLARILCDNTEYAFDQIQKWPMLLKSPRKNPVFQCSDFDNIPNIDFHWWKESPKKNNTPYQKEDNNDEEEEDTDYVWFYKNEVEQEEDPHKNREIIKSAKYTTEKPPEIITPTTRKLPLSSNILLSVFNDSSTLPMTETSTPTPTH